MTGMETPPYIVVNECTSSLRIVLPDSRYGIAAYMKILKTILVATEKGNVQSSGNHISSFSGINMPIVAAVLQFFASIGIIKYSEKDDRVYLVPGMEKLFSKENGKVCISIDAFRMFLSSTWFGSFILRYLELHGATHEDEICAQIESYARVNKYQRQNVKLLLEFLKNGDMFTYDEDTRIYELSDMHTYSITSDMRLSVPSSCAKIHSDCTANMPITITVSIDEKTDIGVIADKIMQLKDRLERGSRSGHKR